MKTCVYNPQELNMYQVPNNGTYKLHHEIYFCFCIETLYKYANSKVEINLSPKMF